MTNARILQAEAARAALLRGAEQMTALLRPTLGPIPRTVAVAPILGNDPPEILDSAATIARRTIQLRDPFEDMGGMLVRHLVERVFEAVGDGSATAAVVAQALMREAATQLAAGRQPLSLKRGLEQGLTVALAELRGQARVRQEPAEIADLVAGIVRDPRLARMIGQIVDAVGADGAISVEDAPRAETTCEYVDGVRWDAGYVSHFLLKAGETAARLLSPRVLVTDQVLASADQLLPVLEACVQAGERNLLIIATEVRDAAVGLLVVNRERGVLEGALAVKAPSIGDQRTRILEDLAVLTGARFFPQDLPGRLEAIRIEDLGAARQVWATATAFGILGGRGSRAAVRERIVAARAELSASAAGASQRDRIRERIGKLAGAAVILRVGAPSASEQHDLKLRLEAALAAGRAALAGGVVPGGGAALLACVPALEGLALEGDERAGVRVLARALAEPLRVLAANAGLEPGLMVEEARRRGPDWTFDLVQRAWVDPWQTGILDPLPVMQAVLETSVSAAATAMTTEVLVRCRRPPSALEA